MTNYRGLLTDREREILSGEANVSENYVYQIRTRVREKIDRLAEDFQILDRNQPDLFEEIEAIFSKFK